MLFTSSSVSSIVIGTENVHITERTRGNGDMVRPQSRMEIDAYAFRMYSWEKLSVTCPNVQAYFCDAIQ